MAKKKRLSRDQQRKAKLVKRASHAHSSESPLAYKGNKYKADEYVPIVYRTELGIHEADVMLKRQLLDAAVRAALEKLVGQLRQGSLPPLEDRGHGKAEAGHEEEFVAWNIRRNWEIMSEEEGVPRPSSEVLIGILRTLLNSANVWSSPGRHSRGYLNFLQGFMRKTGARVQSFSSDMEPLPEPPEDELVAIGREWCQDGDPAVGEEFMQMAEQRIRAGGAEDVVAASQQLLGEFGGGIDERVTQQLSVLSLRAQEAIRKRLT